MPPGSFSDLTPGEFWRPYWNGRPRFKQDVYDAVGEMWCEAWRGPRGGGRICEPAPDARERDFVEKNVEVVLAMVRVKR